MTSELAVSIAAGIAALAMRRKMKSPGDTDLRYAADATKTLAEMLAKAQDLRSPSVGDLSTFFMERGIPHAAARELAIHTLAGSTVVTA